MSGVFFCSPFNSTHFTSCCRVAVTATERKCPRCQEYVYPYDARMTEEEMREFEGYHGHKANMFRNSYARRRYQ